MGGYWTRQRLLLSLILAIAVAGITGFLFVSPYLEQYAVTYNEQSIYKNTDADFIAPEPSFEQISELPGQNGIEAVFPFYLTKTEVKVNDKSRITTVLLSDQFQNVDMTMYNDKRLLSKESEKSENPIWVDWQFCHDTTSGVGDTVSFSIGGNNVNYTITAVYETNSIYDGGAILAEISTDQKNAIAANAKSNGYSGMYISASDYSVCRTYLTMDYRPLGRLKDQSQFDSEEQYKIHYDAIMSSGYANEITDFKIRQNDLESKINPVMVFIGALLALIMTVVFNVAMSNRDCEKGYFKKHCIPKGQNVNGYYLISFCFETFITILLFCGAVFLRLQISNEYIPIGADIIWIVLIPIAIVIAEIFSLYMNKSKVAVIAANVKEEQVTKD